MIELLPPIAFWLLVNTILIDLLARGIGRLAVLHIETRLLGAFIILAGTYLLLSGGAVTASNSIIMIGTTAAGALFILSRYRKAARRVMERRNTGA